jgi:hypothetical protein
MVLKKILTRGYNDGSISTIEASRINGYGDCLNDIMDFINAYGGDKE